jgi:putative acetyltransferase
MNAPFRQQRARPVEIRPERPTDIPAIRAVTADAFRTAEHSTPPIEPDGAPGEATLVGRLREDSGWIPDLSLVAELEGEIVGHVVATRGRVTPSEHVAPSGRVTPPEHVPAHEHGSQHTDGQLPDVRGHRDVSSRAALGLGPLSVAPAHQRRGVGSALVAALVERAGARGEQLIVVLGDPAFYGRLGFGPAGALGISAPDPSWGEAFQARPLAAYDGFTGTFRYALPFEQL